MKLCFNSIICDDYNKNFNSAHLFGMSHAKFLFCDHFYEGDAKCILRANVLEIEQNNRWNFCSFGNGLLKFYLIIVI